MIRLLLGAGLALLLVAAGALGGGVVRLDWNREPPVDHELPAVREGLASEAGRAALGGACFDGGRLRDEEVAQGRRLRGLTIDSALVDGERRLNARHGGLVLGRGAARALPDPLELGHEGRRGRDRG